MKVRYKLALAGILFLIPAQTLTVYAGSLNANGQELLSIISGTETYNGITYQMDPAYVNQARAYFLQDNIDVTDEQKQKAINEMYSSIQEGIDGGYLIPVDGGAQESGGEAQPTQSEGTEVTGGGQGSGESGQSESSAQEGAALSPNSGDGEAAGIWSEITGSGLTEQKTEETVSPVIEALEKVEETVGEERAGDFPLEEVAPAFPYKLIRTADYGMAAVLVLMAAAAVRCRLFSHHYQKKRKRHE